MRRKACQLRGQPVGARRRLHCRRRHAIHRAKAAAAPGSRGCRQSAGSCSRSPAAASSRSQRAAAGGKSWRWRRHGHAARQRGGQRAAALQPTPPAAAAARHSPRAGWETGRAGRKGAAGASKCRRRQIGGAAGGARLGRAGGPSCEALFVANEGYCRTYMQDMHACVCCSSSDGRTNRSRTGHLLNRMACGCDAGGGRPEADAARGRRGSGRDYAGLTGSTIIKATAILERADFPLSLSITMSLPA